MWDTIKKTFARPSLKNSIRVYDSLLRNRFGFLKVDPNGAAKTYRDSQNADPAMVEAYELHAAREVLNYDQLKAAKRALSKADYHRLQQDLVWRKNIEGTGFCLWRDLYTHPDEDFCSPAIGGVSGFGQAISTPLKLPDDFQTDLSENLPPALYLHASIVEDPRIDSMAMIRSFPKTYQKRIQKYEKKARSDPFSEVPRFYGDLEAICAIRYFAKEAYLPTGGIIEQINEHYQRLGFEPLAYNLACPWIRGGRVGGWSNGRWWEQFWLSEAGDAAMVSLQVGGSLSGEVTVFSLYCPSEYSRAAVEHYRRVHAGGKRPTVPPYREFEIFPLPPYGYGLSEELRAWQAKVVSSPLNRQPAPSESPG